MYEDLRRTESLENFAETGTVVIASVQTTICMLGIAMVNWDVGVDKVTLYDMSECCHGEKSSFLVPGTT